MLKSKKYPVHNPLKAVFAVEVKKRWWKCHHLFVKNYSCFSILQLLYQQSFLLRVLLP